MYILNSTTEAGGMRTTQTFSAVLYRTLTNICRVRRTHNMIIMYRVNMVLLVKTITAVARTRN
jgi:hypothetical protein